MKIFINMISLFTGGPKTVGFGIIEGICRNVNHEWEILLPSGRGYEEYIKYKKFHLKENIKITYAKYPDIIFKPIFKFYYDNIATAFFYYFKKNQIVFMTANFSSFFIRPSKQIILEHNALYFEKYSSKFDNNKFKFFFGKAMLNYSLSFKPKIIVQLDCIKNKIIELYKYPPERIKVVTMVPPLKSNLLHGESEIASILKTVLNQDGKLRLFFPANFYPGKNHKILIPLAEIIIKNNDKVVIFVTLPNNCELMKEVRLRHLGKIIINLGYIENSQIDKVYQLVDCLLFPSYVESYGMPYVEAIRNSIPIITADYDFSREICGSAAIFFKQNCIESLHQAVRQCADIEYFGRLKVAVKNEKSRFEHDWASVIDKIFPRQPWC